MHRFIRRVVLRFAVNAAIGRGRVYASGVAELDKRNFKEAAKDWLENFGESYDRASQCEETYLAAIGTLADHLSTLFSRILKDGHVRIGTSQKMLTLYLKCLWRLGDETKEPLFAVVDRNILSKARVVDAPNWTEMDDLIEYRRIVKEIDAFARRNNYKSGAEWESETWTDEDNLFQEE